MSRNTTTAMKQEKLSHGRAQCTVVASRSIVELRDLIGGEKPNSRVPSHQKEQKTLPQKLGTESR